MKIIDYGQARSSRSRRNRMPAASPSLPQRSSYVSRLALEAESGQTVVKEKALIIENKQQENAKKMKKMKTVIGQ